MTELVINALKHAFPGQQTGTIAIDYCSTGNGWTLCVTDDGIGMPSGKLTPGLGTGIVEALARNLESEIQLSGANPGTAVPIRHRGDVDHQTRPPEAA